MVHYISKVHFFIILCVVQKKKNIYHNTCHFLIGSAPVKREKERLIELAKYKMQILKKFFCVYPNFINKSQ